MASAACCKAGEPVAVNYEPKGTRQTTGDMEVYTVGSGPPVLIIYDIFGLDFNQVFQVADRISANGYSVAVPDFFRGKPWPMSKIPPGPEDDMMGWIRSRSDFEAQVKPDLEAALALLGAAGTPTAKVGILGFCWGGPMALLAGSDPKYVAVGGAHPSFKLLPENGAAAAAAVKCPVALLPTQGDDIQAVRSVLEASELSGKFVCEDFTDQVHGFMTARGDWSDPKVAAKVAEGIDIFSSFLKTYL